MDNVNLIDKVKIELRNLEEIEGKAQEFITSLGDRHIIAFYGQMGAGKTTFIRAICEALGVREPVTSPTFAIVNEYAGLDAEKIYHFDFYRLRRIEEAYDMGFEDYFDSGYLCLIEWPELIEDFLPSDTVRVHITVDDSGTRHISW